MKKNFLKKLVAGVLAATLGVTALAGCGSAKTADKGDQVYRTLDEIKDSGEINIGVFSDKNPFGYVDDNGDYQGYDVYFAERLGKDLGVKINYVSTEAANRVEYLETGKVDVILANFTVTDERAEKVDFALPYMNVALGVVSHEDNVIKSLDEIGADDQVIVISGTTAETYLEKNEPDIKLQKFDTYAAAKTAFENGTGVAWANDNTEVIAYAKENEGYVVGISSLGDQQSIAPAVTKGNSTLLNWINDEIKSLGKENFFHADYEATLLDTYGADYEDTLVIEGGGDAADKTDTEATTEEGKLDITPGNGETIKVAASPIPHAEILAKAADILKDYGYDLEVTEFDDYVQPNLVVESGEFDANYMEHLPYLNSFNKEQGTHLVDAGDIHYEPFGIYPGTKSKLEDIAENPHNLQFVELEAAQVARVVNEVEFVVLNGNYALEAGYSVGKDAIAYEANDSIAAKTYVNIIAVEEGNENSDKIKALVSVLRSDEIKKFIEDTYDGAVIFYEK